MSAFQNIDIDQLVILIGYTLHTARDILVLQSRL